MTSSIASVLVLLSVALDSTDREVQDLVVRIESHEPILADGLISVAVEANNSVVDVNTPVIDRLIDIGVPAVPPLIAEMEKGISFHRFTYCYSACNQILRKGKRHNYVLWSGGCDFDGDTIVARGHQDVSAFRASVVADIKAKYKLALTKP